MIPKEKLPSYLHGLLFILLLINLKIYPKGYGPRPLANVLTFAHHRNTSANAGRERGQEA